MIHQSSTNLYNHTMIVTMIHSNHCINASRKLPLIDRFFSRIVVISTSNWLKNSANRLLDDVTEGQWGRYLESLSPLLCELRKSLVRIKFINAAFRSNPAWCSDCGLGAQQVHTFDVQCLWSFFSAWWWMFAGFDHYQTDTGGGYISLQLSWVSDFLFIFR